MWYISSLFWIFVHTNTQQRRHLFFLYNTNTNVSLKMLSALMPVGSTTKSRRSHAFLPQCLLFDYQIDYFSNRQMSTPALFTCHKQTQPQVRYWLFIQWTGGVLWASIANHLTFSSNCLYASGEAFRPSSVSYEGRGLQTYPRTHPWIVRVRRKAKARAIKDRTIFIPSTVAFLMQCSLNLFWFAFFNCGCLWLCHCNMNSRQTSVILSQRKNNKKYFF